MRLQIVRSLAVTLISCAFAASAVAAEVPRIMPVGDSITEGGSSFKVYRGPLYDKLTAAGIKFEYTGSKSSNHNGTALRYEAYGGKNATQVADYLRTNFPSYPADFVLIHSGHNMNVAGDVLDDTKTAEIIKTIEAATRQMVATCRATNPKVTMLIAQVITSGKLPKYSYIPALNKRLAELATELNTPASRVLSVDQATGWNPETDTVADKVHPSAQGAEKMAAKWFAALEPLLKAAGK